MPTDAALEQDLVRGTSDAEHHDELRHLIAHAAHFLPSQGPITVFVHHNTLHAFEDFPFHEAVVRGARRFGHEPYLSEVQYRNELGRKRIRLSDIEAILEEDLGKACYEKIVGLCTRGELRQGMLQYALGVGTPTELRWLVAESDALRRFRTDCPETVRGRIIDSTRHWVMRDLSNGHRNGLPNDNSGIRSVLDDMFERFSKPTIERWNNSTWEAFCLQLLWRICRNGVRGVPASTVATSPAVRHRDILLQATAADSDRLVNTFLTQFCAAYLDQGFATWPLPDREQGLHGCFSNLYRQPSHWCEPWRRGLSTELQRLEAASLGPEESILESLELLGVSPEEREEFLTATLLALPGWAGMVWQMESNAEWAALPAPKGSLIGYVAVRLILERLALAHIAKAELAYDGPLAGLRECAGPRISRQEPVSDDLRAFLVFQLAQVMEWTPEELNRLSNAQWSTLVREIEAFSGIERRRAYHHAYERRYRIQTLDAIACRSKHRKPRGTKPRFQVACCIDEREESFRRHLEEVSPEVETFGVAGFFGVAMYYRGAADAHYVPLCPVVIRPQHYVREEVAYSLQASHRRRAETRKALGQASHRVHVGSRTFLGGMITALFGSLLSVPLVTRVLFPRLTTRIHRMFDGLVQIPPVTRLQIERVHANPGAADDQIGYTLDEMAGIVERLLRDIGLTSDLANLVIITGHGSSSLNNPHEAAHDCGACGGARGGPNARAFALMANDPRVRERLARNGLVIPDSVVFVGAYHNTCDDSTTFYDLDHLPLSHIAEFESARAYLDLARERNAHERCRRFESAPFTLTQSEALRHVEGRAEDLAQTRPEYGHATNALCIVGRRALTRGLFLDRRAFLTSYDPDQDNENFSILAGILGAVFPVCAGISLEYYFSFVDPTGWGCGTKLPHNLTSLLGVMDGAASDLRPGLPWQMVEIHEPVRQLFIIETVPEAMLKIMENNETIGRLCRNEWVQLATIDPHSSAIHVFHKGQFEPYRPETTELPQVKSSVDWYRGWRDHLGYAVVTGSSNGRPHSKTESVGKKESTAHSEVAR